MELRQLRFFLRVAETLHFGRAAQMEHIAQSVVSSQIARLERELGVQLFVRTSRRVELTPAGNTFHHYAQRVLAEVSAGTTAAQEEGKLRSRKLRVGAFTSDALMLTVLAEFHRRCPTVELTFVELTMVNQIAKVVDGDVDIAFIWEPITDPRVRADPLYSDLLVAALPENHRLANASHIRAEDLVDERFAVPAAGASDDWRSHWSLDDLRGSGPRVGATVESMREILAAIAYGDVIDTATQNSTSMVPYPGVRYIPIVGAEPSTLALASTRDSVSIVAEEFRRIAHHTVRERIAMLPGATIAL